MSLLGIYIGHQIGTLIGISLAHLVDEKGGVEGIINDLKYKSLANDKNVDTSFDWKDIVKEDNHGKSI